jgi:iron complex outermembrane recepter protein
VNLPYSSINGIEASMQSRVGHLGFNLSADYNRSKLGSATTARTYAFPSDYGITNQCGPGQTPNAGNTNCTNYAPYLVTLSGESLPFSPLFQGNATLKYDFPVGATMTLEPRITYSYTDKQYAALFQIPYYEEPAHGLMNAYLDWVAGPWTTTVFATNVTNKLYVTSLTATNEYFGNPRQIGLQFSRSY